jgi:hypothetical protein
MMQQGKPAWAHRRRPRLPVQFQGKRSSIIILDDTSTPCAGSLPYPMRKGSPTHTWDGWRSRSRRDWARARPANSCANLAALRPSSTPRSRPSKRSNLPPLSRRQSFRVSRSALHQRNWPRPPNAASPLGTNPGTLSSLKRFTIPRPRSMSKETRSFGTATPSPLWARDARRPTGIKWQRTLALDLAD